MGYSYIQKYIFLFETCALIQKAPNTTLNFLTFLLAVNTRCLSNMVSINRSLHLYPWKNHNIWNWNGSFVCPKTSFAWLKLVFWSRIAYFAAMNLIVTFSPAVNAQCQSNMASMRRILRSCPWKNRIHFNWKGSFTCQKIYFAFKIKTCAQISNSLFYSNDLLTFSLAVNAPCQSNMASMRQIFRSCPRKNY